MVSNKTSTDITILRCANDGPNESKKNVTSQSDRKILKELLWF